jgi:glycerol-3-phosphate dehydrogenase
MTEEEIEGFLAEINDAYPAAGLKRQDVAYVFGGLVPMVENGHRTADVQLMKRYLIHDHQRENGGEGLISVRSVKYTEARHVAEKVVDLIFEKLGRKAPACRTAVTPLHGGKIEQFDSYVNEQVRRNSLPEHMVRHLILQYGTAYAEVLKSFDGHAEGMTDNARVMKAEVLHAVRKEMAQKLADVVFRRTGSGITGSPGEACLRSCATVMAEELGWDDMRVQKEVEEVSALF